MSKLALIVSIAISVLLCTPFYSVGISGLDKGWFVSDEPAVISDIEVPVHVKLGTMKAQIEDFGEIDLSELAELSDEIEHLAGAGKATLALCSVALAFSVFAALASLACLFLNKSGLGWLSLGCTAFACVCGTVAWTVYLGVVLDNQDEVRFEDIFGPVPIEVEFEFNFKPDYAWALTFVGAACSGINIVLSAFYCLSSSSD
jgi:hypothetical protein